jgi:predicted GTPase
VVSEGQRRKVIILGAGGRDFHNFNTALRDRRDLEVVAFTATQIPHIDSRTYPASLAGALYPKGIPIVSEDRLEELVAKHGACQVIFAYSDVNYDYLGHMGARVNALGCDFTLLGTAETMIPARVPVIAVTAVRTGSGKSQTTRKIARLLVERGLRTVAIRHPMPYGDLEKQAVQRFACLADLDLHECTIEEREEYEPHITAGTIVYAGVDYGRILEEAQKEADVILWDGGNNDFSFYRPDLTVVVADPHRAGHETRYYPGETNVRLADVVVINKVGTTDDRNVIAVRDAVMRLNPRAVVIPAASPITVTDGERMRGKRVLVVEDGPTLTHGEMTYGAGMIAARQYGAAETVDPRPWVTGEIAETFARYPGIGTLLPAMGYGEAQMKDLERTINAVDCDIVLVATPIDLGALLKLDKPALRAGYELEEIGSPKLCDILDEFLAKHGLAGGAEGGMKK